MKKLNNLICILFIGLLALVGCTPQEEVPIEIQKEIQEIYSNIDSYSATVQNRLSGDKYDVDQEWELSIEKPNKYKKSLTTFNDAPYETENYEICNGNTLYALEEGTKSEIEFNCLGLVRTHLDLFSQLNYFTNKEIYESSAVYEKGDIKLTITHIESKGKSEVFVDPNNYIIKKVRYITKQVDDSVSIREEYFKNIKLNIEFDNDEFKVPSN